MTIDINRFFSWDLKTKGDMYVPGTNHRPICYIFDFRVLNAMVFGHSLTVLMWTCLRHSCLSHLFRAQLFLLYLKSSSIDIQTSVRDIFMLRCTVVYISYHPPLFMKDTKTKRKQTIASACESDFRHRMPKVSRSQQSLGPRNAIDMNPGVRWQDTRIGGIATG